MRVGVGVVIHGWGGDVLIGEDIACHNRLIERIWLHGMHVVDVVDIVIVEDSALWAFAITITIGVGIVVMNERLLLCDLTYLSIEVISHIVNHHVGGIGLLVWWLILIVRWGNISIIVVDIGSG